MMIFKQNMKQTHELHPEQHAILSSMSDENVVNSFLKELNGNYGAGEVLQYGHMLDIFAKRYHQEEDKWLTIYVDTVRMLNLIVKEDKYILMVENYLELKKLHNRLSKKIKIDEAITPLYADAVKKYLKLNQTITCEGYKVRFELISTLDELKNEGHSMEHCIASYAHIIAAGQYVGFRVFEEDRPEGRFTLGLHKNAVEGFELSFDQLKGAGNIPASKPACLAAIYFCKKNGIRVSEETDYDLRVLKF